MPWQTRIAIGGGHVPWRLASLQRHQRRRKPGGAPHKRPACGSYRCALVELLLPLPLWLFLALQCVPAATAFASVLAAWRACCQPALLLLPAAGSLSVDIIPFAATQPEHVVPLYQSSSAFITAYGSRLAWSGSLAADILPAAGTLPLAGRATNANASTSGSGSRLAEAADVFLRLRYCPSAVRRQVAAPWATSPPPNPFSNASSSDGAALEQLQLALGSNGGSTAERTAAASDGGGGGRSSSSSSGSSSGSSGSSSACDAPVALPAGAGEAQCAAARRLLQCSESLVFLTEFKDARLAPANVTAASQPLDTHQPLTVMLSSDAVALFVSPESEQQVGRFNSSAQLLLPWQPQTVALRPIEGRSSQQEAAAGQPAAEDADPAAPNGSAAGVSVYWLQDALAALQPAPAAASEGRTAEQPPSSGFAAAVPIVYILLCLAPLIHL